MSGSDKIHNAAQDPAGKSKEAVGKVTDDEDLEAEVKGDQAKAGIRQAGEKVKDVFNH